MAPRTYVVKLGGNAAGESEWLNPLLAACRVMLGRGLRLVLVHGGGPQADALLGQLGIPVSKVNGRRITDAATLSVLKMVYAGSINTDLVSAALRFRLPALGISALSDRLAQARRRPRVLLTDRTTGRQRRVDFGLVGDIRRVNRTLLLRLLAAGCLPVIASLAAGPDGQVLNVNADALATAIAGALRAFRLVYVTDVGGIRPEGASGPTAPSLSIGQAKALIRSGKVTGGMVAKLESAEQALNRGVASVLVVGALTTRRQWLEALLGQRSGTVLTRN